MSETAQGGLKRAARTAKIKPKTEKRGDLCVEDSIADGGVARRNDSVANKPAGKGPSGGNGPRKLAVRPKVVRYIPRSGASGPCWKQVGVQGASLPLAGYNTRQSQSQQE